METSCEPFFPNVKKSTAKLLCSIFNWFTPFVQFCVDRERYVSTLVVIMNILHFIILTKKSMRTTSINLIMAAVALSDICSQSYILHHEIIRIFIYFYPCYSKATYYNIFLLENIMNTLRNFTRRCSTWLSLSIAVIRTLVIRNPMNPKYEKLSKPKTAFTLILVIYALCFPLAVVEYLGNRDNETTSVYYYSGYSDWFTDNDYMVYKLFYDTEGVVSKLFPCILFPIFTTLLIIEIRKAEKSRQNLFVSKSDSRNTTKLIFYLTLTFFIGEFPMALFYGLNPVLLMLNEEGFQ
ncbi:hypothetical protein CRE_08965 [Caenorhabditis remanei]|uniref:G-protein coupled receptors family 1 profile domain-containing protein n=1 Tax=Caenorhabditis remanei TaxID=31234 RepID=E3LII1_CAERE|nr:hypothetical protein CRE_08965 [Caenorhabditis remanei]